MQNNVNIALAMEKGIIIDNNFANYEQLVEIYKLLFTKYLEFKIDLKKYDDRILNSDLDFGIMPDSNKSTYQRRSFLNLNYIYIRSNFYIEKLDLEDIKFLNNVNVNNFSLSQDIINFIERTYKDVINDNYRHGKYVDNTNTCYGAFIPDNIVDSKLLAICIQYGKNNKQYSDKEYLKNSKLKNVFLKNLAMELKIDFKENLNMDIAVLIRNFVGEN